MNIKEYTKKLYFGNISIESEIECYNLEETHYADNTIQNKALLN